MMEKLTKYVEDNYKDIIELEEVGDSIHIHMPLFGDYMDVPKNELDTQIIDKLANKIMKARLSQWISENFPRCIPKDKWKDLGEDELNLQLKIANSIRFIIEDINMKDFSRNRQIYKKIREEHAEKRADK